MGYRVLLTEMASRQLDDIVEYIAIKLCNPAAARSILDDVDEAVKQLMTTADCYSFCKESELAELGYMRFHLRKHRYVLLYRIVDQYVYVERIFHELQDYRYLIL